MSETPGRGRADGEGARGAVDPERVADYLRDHPDFFVGREALLADLILPHGSTGSVSLVERQLAVLRERNADMRRRLAELVRTARINHEIFEHTLALVRRLLRTEGPGGMVAAFGAGLAEGFDVDQVGLRGVEDSGLAPELAGALHCVPRDEAVRRIGSLLRPGRVVCGRLRPAELDFLFGDHAETVGSAAVLPLDVPGGLLVIALGSASADHFTSDMGTLFLEFLGDTLAALLDRRATAAGLGAEAPGAA